MFTDITDLPSIAAGFPSPADDYLENSLSLDDLIIRHPDATFFVRVEGNSMIGASIYPEDILVVDRSLKAQHNNIIVVCLDGEFSVKRLIKKKGELILQSENNSYPDIPIFKYTNVIVWGVVTHIIHKSL